MRLWDVVLLLNMLLKLLRAVQPEDTPLTGKSRYLLRNRNSQRIRSNQEIQEMMEDTVCDDDSNSNSEFDEVNIEIDPDVDIAEYRELLDEISKGQAEKEGEPDIPDFIKNLDQQGYRQEDIGSDEDHSQTHGEDSGQGGRTMNTPPICPDSDHVTPKNKRKKRCQNRVLTYTAMLAIIAELKEGRAKNVKVSPKEILKYFLSEECFTVSDRVMKNAANTIQQYRKHLRKVETSKGKISYPLGDDPVYDFSGSIEPRTSRGPYTDKPFAELSGPGRDYRTKACLSDISRAIEEICRQRDVPFDVVQGKFRKQYGSNVNKKGPSTTETLAHMIKLKATKRTATGISQFVQNYDLYIPGERALRTEKRKRLPPVVPGRFIKVGDGEEQLPVGVFAKRRDIVKLTLMQLIEMKHVQLSDSDTRVILHMKFNQGMDGAGSHQEVFDKQSVKLTKAGHGLKSCQTFAMTLITCSTALEETVHYNENPSACPDRVLYRCQQTNSYKNVKVLGLVMEKESADLQSFLLKKYPDGKVQYTFTVGGVSVVVYCDYVTCMVDGKTRKAMVGRGGGYCYHCSMTSKEYHTPAGVRVEDSFIEYNCAEKLKEYQQFLTGDGVIDTDMDSEKRKGWTKVPFGIPHGVVVTHASLNIARWVVQLAAKANIYASNPEYAGHETWEMTGSDLQTKFAAEENAILDKLKKGGRRLVMKDVGHGHTGRGLTGNHAKKFLCYAKEELPPLIEDQSKGQKLAKISELLYVVIRVLNTNNKIDVKLYKHICHMIGILVITNFPWARMNETLHSILAHSWEVIENNDSCGVKDVSEEGIEALQKHVRFIRCARAWLGDYITNLTQAMETLILGGDLYLNLLATRVPDPNKGRKREEKQKPLIPEGIESSSDRGGINFLKRVILGADANVDEEG